MIDLPPGLTCGHCEQPIYPHTARATDYGYTHAGACPRTCSIEGCENEYRSKGWCKTHYDRWRRLGHPLTSRTYELDDVEWMAAHGEHLDGAAERLGMLPGSLASSLRRQGRADLSDALIARNPRDWNRSTCGDGQPTTRTPQGLALKQANRNEARRASRRERTAA